MANAFSNRDEQNGQLAGAKIKELLVLFQKDILTGVEAKIDSLNVPHTEPHNDDILITSSDAVNGEVPTYCDWRYFTFHYAEDGSLDNEFWQVPKEFIFPKVDHCSGFWFWVQGMPQNHVVNSYESTHLHPIMSFCLLNHKLLQKNPGMPTM